MGRHRVLIGKSDGNFLSAAIKTYLKVRMFCSRQRFMCLSCCTCMKEIALRGSGGCKIGGGGERNIGRAELRMGGGGEGPPKGIEIDTPGMYVW